MDTTTHAGNFYEKGTYAITLNPCDKHQSFGNVQRLVKFRNFINESFLHYPQIGIHYKLFIELSECMDKLKISSEVNHQNNGPRLHIHGTLTFHSNKSVRRFLLVELYKLAKIGQVKIKQITDLEGWDKYCTKQKHIMNTSPISNEISEDSE